MSPAGATRRRRREEGDPIAPAVGVVAIVGRPNVGKSTLFNRLTGTRRAIVDAFAGLTRDRLYGVVEWGGKRFTIVDTAGLDVPLPRDAAPDIAALTRATREQAQMAITEADVCCFMVDVRDGVTALDEEIAQTLRRGGRPVILVGNKADSQVDRYRADELYRLGLGDPVLISALQGTDTGDLLDRFVSELPENGAAGTEPAAGEVSVAIIGRPNTGKSSLLNGLVGSERALVSPVAGTTRDVVDTVVSLDGRKIRLVDTAGIRRRGIVTENVERYSLLRSLRALQRSDIGLLVIDASEGASAQDRHIAGYAVEAGAGLVVAANKWDLVKHEERVDRGISEEAAGFVLLRARRSGADAVGDRAPQSEAGDARGARGCRCAVDPHPDAGAEQSHPQRARRASAPDAQGTAPQDSLRYPGSQPRAHDRALRQRPRADALRVPALPREPDPRGVRLRGGAIADRHPASRRERRLSVIGLVGPGR